MPIHEPRKPLRRRFANRAPDSSIRAASFPATRSPGMSDCTAELASVLALPCTMTFTRFTLNLACFGPLSILNDIQWRHSPRSSSQREPPRADLCPSKPIALSSAPNKMDMCSTFRDRNVRSMHGATLATARALSANVNRSTTRPQNTNPVSTHISIAVELTIITEDITSAGARMLNSSENVPAMVLISPTYPYVETVAFIKHFFDHAGGAGGAGGHGSPIRFARYIAILCAVVKGHPSFGDESSSVVMSRSFTGGSGNGSGAVPFLFPVAFDAKGLTLALSALASYDAFAEGGHAVSTSTFSERMNDAPPNRGTPATM